MSPLRARRDPWSLASALALAALGVAPSASAVDIPTVYDNMQSFPIGSRAAGMGGAYTALGCDEAALHYNPGALGCARSSRLELAANAYIIQSVSVPDAFGPGNDIDAVNFHSVPTIVGGVRVLADGDPVTGAGRLVFGLSVAVPHSLVLKIEPDRPDQPNSLSLSVLDNITTGDIGLGWQVTPYLSVGLSVGAGLRTASSRLDLLLLGPQVPCGVPLGSGSCYQFLQQSTEEDVLAVGGRAKVGVRFTPTDSLSFGLSAASPSLDVFGRSKLSVITSTALSDGAGGDGFGPGLLRFEGTSDLSLPFRLAVGAAYSTKRFSIALDASLNFPRTIAEAAELEQVAIQGFEALPPSEVAGFEVIHDRTWQPNVNLGVELAVVDPVVIDVGAFTDLSSVSTRATVEESADRIHMFGATLALGILGKQSRGWFGLSFETGVADAKVLQGDLDLQNVIASNFELRGDSTIRRWTLAGFIGSNYSFAAEKEEPKGARPDP